MPFKRLNKVIYGVYSAICNEPNDYLTEIQLKSETKVRPFKQYNRLISINKPRQGEVRPGTNEQAIWPFKQQEGRGQGPGSGPGQVSKQQNPINNKCDK